MKRLGTTLLLIIAQISMAVLLNQHKNYGMDK